MVTTANVVRRSCSSRSTALARVDEAVVHRLEVQEELGDVLEELAAEDAVGHLVEGPARHVEHARAALAADAVRQREPAQQPAAEEVGHARRRVEEVDRVPRRRRVDDDEVVLAARVDLEQALHRDVVVALHEPRGEVVVQPVLEDAVRGLLVLARGAARGRPTTASCRASRPTARRAARCRPPSATSGGTRCARLPMPSSPSAVASRRAGSIVSTSTLPPRRTAAPSAAAAATDVLPTPPEPQNDDDLLRREQLLERRRTSVVGAAAARSQSRAPRRARRRPCA